MKNLLTVLFFAVFCLAGIKVAFAVADYMSGSEYKAAGVVSSSAAYVCQASFTDVNWTSQDRIQLLDGTTSSGTPYITIAGDSQQTVPVHFSPTCLYFPDGIYLKSNTTNVNWSTDLQFTNAV
jgi:hypothetical protein